MVFCGIGQAWAAPTIVRFDFSSKDQITTNTDSKVVWTVETSTFVLEKGTNTISPDLNSPLRIFSGNVGSISAGEGLYFKQVVVYVNSKDPSNLTWTNVSAAVDGEKKEVTLTPSGDNVATIEYAASAQIRLDSIVCTLIDPCTAPDAPLAVSPKTLELEAGQSLKLTISGGNGATPTYTSSDNDVLTVSADGLVTALKKGEATITVAQSANTDGETNYCSQSVELPVMVSNASYTITWQTPTGSTTAKVLQGETIGTALPTAEVASCDTENYPYFAGWITENVGKAGSKEVTFVTAATVPTGNETYYTAFADNAKVEGTPFSCDGSLTSLKNAGGSSQGCSSYNSGSYTIKMETDDAYITVPVKNPETATFKYTRRGGAVTASVELQYTLDTENFTTLETWTVTGAETTNVTTLTNANPFPAGTVGVRFLYKKTSGNIAVGPISVTAKTDFPSATTFITACCDAWTTTPAITLEKNTIDADASGTLSVTSVSGAPAGYAGTVSYASSNPLVATVDANSGVATAKNAGTFRVIATWSGDANFCDNSVASNEVTVTGKVSIEYYKNSDEATGDMATTKHELNAEVTLEKCTFTRTGYHFVGWAEQPDGSKLWNDGDKVTLTANKQLYALWEINTYDITKGEELNGTFTIAAETVNHGGSVEVMVTPTTHYHFLNLSIDPAENGTIDGLTVKNIVGAVTITANFEEDPTYTITWHTGETTATTTVYQGEALGTLPDGGTSCDPNFPEFYGWCASEYGSSSAPKTTKPALIDAAHKPVADADYYAVYADGVDGGGQKMTALPVGVQVLVVSGDSVELGGIEMANSKSIGNATKYEGAPNALYPLNVVAGHTAGSYAFEHDGKYLSYSSSSAADNELFESATLDDYSSWKVSFSDVNATITNVGSSTTRILKYNPPTSSAVARFACYKTTSSATKPIQLIRAGKQVTKWITNCCTPQPFAVRDTTVLIDNISISVDLTELVDGAGNGGEKEFRLAEEYTDAKMVSTALAADKAGKYTAIVSQKATDASICDNEYEIVVTVEPKNSTITFDKNDAGALGEMTPLAAETLTKQQLTGNAFTKEGYHFVAWNTIADGTGTSYADGAEIEMHTLTLYAQWELNTYTVMLNKTGEGTVTLPTEVLHGGAFEVVAEPATGYKLKDIAVTPLGNATLDGDSVKNVTANITVTVQFEELPSYIVTYRDAENAAILTEKVYEGSFANPDLSKFGCERMPFEGFAANQVADNSEAFEAIDVTKAVINSNTTFWVVYGLYKGDARRFDPAKTLSGKFKIAAEVDGVKNFATGALSSGKYASTTDADAANSYDFTQVSAGVYTIQRSGKYVNYNGKGTDFKESTTSSTWTISQGTKGSWRVTVTETSGRAWIFNGSNSKFGAYSTSNVTAGSAYYDIEIIPLTTPRYSSTLDCSTIDVEGVTLSERDTIAVGDKKTLVATVLPENATVKLVVWKSNNEAIATIDAATGEVTGIARGLATITVTTNDENYSASCKLYVRQPVEDISLDQVSISLKECDDNGVKLTATILPEDADNQKVVWTSSDKEVALVSDDGIVYGFTPGTAIITATTVEGGFTAECAVTVTECVKATSLTLDTAALEFSTCENKTYLLKATILPENAENKAVTWLSSNPSVVTVADGLVTPVAAGTATITVATTDGSDLKAECAVSVIECPDALNNVTTLDGLFVRDGRIVIEQERATDVHIYNAVGQTVAAQNAVMTFELTVPQGVYLVVLGDKSQKVVVK